MKIIAMLVIISLAFSLKKEDLFKASPHIQNNETIKNEKGSISSFKSKDSSSKLNNIFSSYQGFDIEEIFGYNLLKCKQPDTNNCIYYCRYNPYMDLCRYNCYRKHCS